MDAPDPIIFHDHICGVFPRIRHFLHEAEVGRISAYDAVFTTEDGGINKAVTLSFILCAAYRMYGQQAFVIGPRLREMFNATSLEGVPADMLKMPFPCLYIALPDCPWQIWGGPTQWHNLTGVMVNYNEANHAFLFYLWGAENENSRVAGDDASFWFSIDANEADRMEVDLETYLLTIMSDRDRDSSDAHPELAFDNDAERQRIYNRVEDTALNVLRVVMNMLIYLTSNEPEQRPLRKSEEERKQRQQIKRKLDDIENSKMRDRQKRRKGEKLQKQLAKLSDAQVTWLGQSIEEAAGQTHDRQPGRKCVRHWVRGHWWPKLANKAAIERWGIRWKQPFERYKDAEAVEPSRHYKFRDDTDEVPK